MCDPEAKAREEAEVRARYELDQRALREAQAIVRGQITGNVRAVSVDSQSQAEAQRQQAQARAQAEAQARAQAEAQARAQAEAQARAQAEAQSRAQAQARPQQPKAAPQPKRPRRIKENGEEEEEVPEILLDPQRVAEFMKLLGEKR